MGKASRARREKIQQIIEARETEGLVKRARLYDRLSQCKLPEDIRWIISDAVVIDANPVRDYLFRYGNVNVYDLPSVAPPFDTCFFEFNPYSDNKTKRQGACVVWDPAEHGYDIATWFFEEKTDGVSRFDAVMMCKLTSNWRILEAAYFGDGRTPQFLSENGVGLVPLMALALLNCRNIELVDILPSPEDSTAHQCRFGVPMTKYKVLRVNPIGKRYEHDDKPQQQFDIMPLHIRRGNFAHYTDDAPLFGKYTGTFWRPATAVGNAKNGVVVKDYKLGEPA